MPHLLPAVRWWIALSCCVVALCLPDAVQAQRFPYGAKVKTKSATVRSGPGEEYYHTDRLPWGSRVEVYRHDDDWAAIRPPQGSYSWVPASAIELTEDTSIGHVLSDGVRTRIGSRFSDDHTSQYVSLNFDEQVKVIARRTLIDDDVPSLWYQITPPAGEFRWVQLASIESLPDLLAPTAEIESPTTASSDESDDGSVGLQVQQAQFLDETSDSHSPQFEPPQFESSDISAPEFSTPDFEDAPSLLSSDSENARANETVPAAPNSLDAATDDSADENATWSLDTLEGSSEPLAVANHPKRSAKAEPLARSPLSVAESSAGADSPDLSRRATLTDPMILSQELARINADLALAITHEATVWDLIDYRARTQAVIDLSATNELRGQAQTLLSRITQLEDIQRRYQNIVQGASQNLLDHQRPIGQMLGNYNAPIAAAPPTATNEASQTDGSAYDGTGWLMPIVTAHPGLPRHALTDDNGNILQFVSPFPGLNLQHYERRRIAVIGRKGFVPRFNKAHLTAERIITLDRVR